MPLAVRITALCLLLLTLGAGVFLSVRTHFIPRFEYGLGIDVVRSAAIAGALAYAIALGATWIARKWKSSVRRYICIVVLATLGIAAVYQGPKQLEQVGFAARNRTPDPVAVGLAVLGGVLALWQIVNLFWAQRLFSNSVLIAVLVFLNVYLFFAAW